MPHKLLCAARKPPDGADDAGSAGLAVHGAPAVPRAELLQLDAVGVVTPVLPGDVVPLLALRTRQGDLRTDVCRLGHGGVPSCSRVSYYRLTSVDARRAELQSGDPGRGPVPSSEGRT